MVQLRGLFRTEVIAKNVGKLVPSSKRMIKWGLIINLKKVEIMLKHSTVSGKRLIRVNEVVVHESRGLLANSFDASFTVDNYFCEVTFTKEDGIFVYDLFIDGIPYGDLVCLFDLSEKDRLCIEKGKVPKRAHRKSVEDEDEDEDEEVDYDAPIEKRVLHRKHRNYLSSQGFGDMDEEEMRKSCVFENLDEQLNALKLDMKVQDAEVDVSDVDDDWEEQEARHHLKDLSKKVVVSEQQKKRVKVFKPKVKKMNGETYGQLK